MAQTLLVADDEAFSRKIVVEMARDVWPHTIIPVSNGADAMAELIGPCARDVAILISDFNMPGVNGLQLLKAIRMGIEGIRRDLPMILLTGHADKGLVGTAIALDVDAFLAKPVSKLILGDKIKRVLAAERSVKAVDSYAHIELREDMLVHWNAVCEPASTVKAAGADGVVPGSILFGLDDVTEGLVLAAPVQFPDGTVVVPAGRVLSRMLIDRLTDLRAMGYMVEPVRVFGRIA